MQFINDYVALLGLGHSDDLKLHFGKRLKAIREARSYTQKELGRLVGLSGNSVARIERGEQGVRWKVLEKFVDVLNIPASQLFPGCIEPVVIEPTPKDALAVLSEFVKKHGG